MRKMFILCIALIASLGAWADDRFVGGDVSLLTKYEEHGAQWLDENGSEIASMLDFLKERGWNSLRVRLFVDPSNASTTDVGQGVCQDLDYVVALSKRIKSAGFALMLDIHYSDSWADPSKQWTPKAWLSMSDDELANQTYEYTRNVLTTMVSNDAAPDFVQIGNEVSYGMMWGASGTSANRCYTSSDSGWERFRKLLAQGSKACREVCPDAKIIIHTERVAQPQVLAGIYERLSAIDYDIIGLSYYPYWHGDIAKLSTALNTLETKFADKQIMIVETGYYHAWQPSTVDYDLSATYSIDEAGQQAFAEALIAELKKHTAVTGLYWWWPEACEYGLDWNTKRVTDSWYNAGLWDNSTGRVLSALSVLKSFLETDGIAPATADASARTMRAYDLSGRVLGQASAQPGKRVASRNGRLGVEIVGW